MNRKKVFVTVKDDFTDEATGVMFLKDMTLQGEFDEGKGLVVFPAGTIHISEVVTDAECYQERLKFLYLEDAEILKILTPQT